MRRGAALLALGVLAVAASGPVAHAHFEPIVPSAIKAPAGNKVFLVGHALGVQIYECASTPAGLGWKFVAPRANLYDNRHKLIITHFGGPTWQAQDGSRVVGKLDASVTVKRTAIPWLLLSRASTTPGPNGGDQLVNTTFIQRIATRGGLAPSDASCHKHRLGVKFESPYSADYFFYKAA